MSFCRAELDLFDFSSYVMLTDVNLVSDCAGPRMCEVRVSQESHYWASWCESGQVFLATPG